MFLRTLAPVGASLILLATQASGSELVVAAAASLREPVEELARIFEGQHPSVRVRVSLGASSSLARQIRLGAPATIFLSADERWVRDLEERGRVAPGDRFPVASNRIVVLGRPGLERPVEEARDLVDPLIDTIALPSAAVPLGDYGRSWLAGQGILTALQPHLVTTEHAKASLVAVEHGHVDAALVYASDAQYAQRSKILFRIPESEHPKIIYSAALLQSGRESPQALAFYAMLAGEDAARVLRSAGFAPLMKHSTPEIE